jgi:Fur family peroxide stress response transcriptional regulator
MIDPEERYQTLLAKIKVRGARITSHRLALLRLLSVSEDHPDASRIYNQLRIQFPTISLATVYKTLHLLKEEGEVLEIPLQNGAHFDGRKPYPHPHLICTNCGKIMDGDKLTFPETANLEIQNVFDFEVSKSQLIFYGVCGQCH